MSYFNFNKILRNHSIPRKMARQYFGNPPYTDIQGWPDVVRRLEAQGWDVYPIVMEDLLLKIKAGKFKGRNHDL